MSKVYMFLADGFETVEALAPADVMRRAGINVVTVSIMGRKTVSSAHGINVEADTLFGDSDYSDADALVLPGGSQGTENLSAFEPLRALLAQTCEAGRIIAAICAAPMVFGRIGLLAGRRATCYPGCEGDLAGAKYTASAVEQDDNIITACGPAASFEFGFAIVENLCGADAVALIREQMRFNDL
jgi:4-methyl-5(b-hydroxyethyl)-thiazole monophosphate biosynthesis